MRSRIQLSTGLATVLACAACGGGGSGSEGGGGDALGIDVPQGTFSVGDTGLADLSVLNITFHALSISGAGATAHLVESGVDDAVTIDALAYQGTAAPVAKKPIPAGDYDTLSFTVTITAKDQFNLDVPVYPLFDPQGATYAQVATTFPLGPNSFSVAEPAEDNQPFLFLHIDVQQSVRDGELAGSIIVGPQIFLSTRLHMQVEGTVTEIDAIAGVFALEDAQGAEYVVQPTDCTAFVGGLGANDAGIGANAVFTKIDVGDTLELDGVLGVDPGCADAAQKAVFFHPKFCRAEIVSNGVTLVTGIVESNTTVGPAQDLALRVVESIDVSAPQGGGGPVQGALHAGDLLDTDIAGATVFTSFGEEQDLTGQTERLQVGEVLTLSVTNVQPAGGNLFTADAGLGFVQPTRIGGMLSDVQASSMTVAGTAAKKSSGATQYDAQAWSEISVGGPSATAIEFGADVQLVADANSEIKVGPLGGWRLTQVVDAEFDNQLAGPGPSDGQQLPNGCYDPATADIDIDVGSLTAYVNHEADGDDTWTIKRFDVTVFGDVTQKYVAWYAGTPSCSQASNGSWANQPCIATSSMHREHIDLDGGAPTSAAQSGAGAFGTSILNAGARVPGATIPTGSDTAGWDDVNQLVLLGIDFDADMYPFDDTAESCVGMSERVWVDVSSAQFFYFAVDPNTNAVDMQYLNTYADFKEKVIAMQDAQQNSCSAGEHENAGFGFTGLVDKESLVADGLGNVVPVIRAIDGRVFNGGCVPNVP